MIIAFLMLLFGSTSSTAEVPKPYIQSAGIVADGLHLWYEIKADPEDSSRLIICGTKWDALANTPFGFVYFSGDSGRTWHTALEDRSSVWVTEHSCAMGSHHLAYFVSNAARQEQIGANPVIGTARLFFSVDSGEHWVEKTKIGWTDYSSSAVSKTSGRLYTFFHAGLLTRDPNVEQGNTLGLLVFSPDGEKVAGPYLSSSGVGNSPYTGIYPSDAVALPSGAVIALYYASRLGPRGPGIEVGTVRADASPEPKLSQIAIGHQQNDISCLNVDDGALTYDPVANRLFVIYQEGCGSASRVMLATSNDEGKTWSAGVPVAMPKNGSGRVSSPSLITMSGHTLGLLWEDKPFSPLWFFSSIENNSSVAPPIALSEESGSVEISNDSLWTSIVQPGQLGPSANTSPDAVIGVEVQDMENALWRTDGMTATKGGIIAIWSAGTGDGMQLHSALIDVSGQGFHPNALQTPEFEDVTRDMLLMYGGEQSYAGQYYDVTNRTLTICSAIRNRSEHAIKSPIEVRLESLHSNWGSVSVLNATNSLPGPGAVWDISRLLTGDRIAGGAKSNPFCMAFRFGSDPKRPSLRDLDLLSFSLKVLAKHEDPPATSRETYEPHN